MPERMARRKASSDHRPIPVSGSGVILVEKIVPNGVATGKPPVKFLAPRTVWQSLQLPSAASSRPRLTSSGSKDCGGGGSIAAITRRQTSAPPTAAPAMTSAARTPPMMPDLAIRACGLFPGSQHDRALLADDRKARLAACLSAVLPGANARHCQRLLPG